MFIPKRINVGFKEKEVANQVRLAYVIYWDEKGVLRKEPSWNSWRNQDVPAKEFDNEPTEGFMLNLRAGGWGQRRTYCEVIDPRGFMVEITIDNLLELLAECDCDKKVLKGKFVYAWFRAELRIIMVGTEAYNNIMKHTENIKKVSNNHLKAKDLIPFHIYKDLAGSKMAYLGCFDIYSVDRIQYDIYKREWFKYDSKYKPVYIGDEEVKEYQKVPKRSDYRVKYTPRKKYCFISGWYFERFPCFHFEWMDTYVSVPKKLVSDVGVLSDNMISELSGRMKRSDVFSPIRLDKTTLIDFTEEIYNEFAHKYEHWSIVHPDGKVERISHSAACWKGSGFVPYTWDIFTEKFGRVKVFKYVLENGNEPDDISCLIEDRSGK